MLPIPYQSCFISDRSQNETDAVEVRQVIAQFLQSFVVDLAAAMADAAYCQRELTCWALHHKAARMRLV